MKGREHRHEHSETRAAELMITTVLGARTREATENSEHITLKRRTW